MPHASTIAASLVANPTPILLPDTCALLDLVRAPMRGKAFEIQAARKVLAGAANTPAGCSLVVSSLVPREFAGHVTAGESELVKHVEALDFSIREFRRCCDALTVAAGAMPAMTAVPDLATLGLHPALATLARSLLAAATPLDADAAAAGRAMARVLQQRRPARGGKGAKDANIVEEYLGFCAELRARGYARTIVFLSSNTNDFSSDTSTKREHGDLAADFAAVGLEYCVLWKDAVARLGL